MATSSSDRNFRKVDVDKYDEDAYQEEAEASTDTFNEAEITSAINDRKFTAAVKLMCSSPVVTNKNKEQKISLVDCFLKLSFSMKTPDIEKSVKELTYEEQNSLMKVVYMVFALKPEADLTTTHVWFDKIFSEVGHGAILRVLTDRNAVVLK